MPAPGYYWTPGYWAWNRCPDFYWVPGAWVEPPHPGVLWTPGFWAFTAGLFAFHPGYWGPHVGFYGGTTTVSAIPRQLQRRRWRRHGEADSRRDRSRQGAARRADRGPGQSCARLQHEQRPVRFNQPGQAGGGGDRQAWRVERQGRRAREGRWLRSAACSSRRRERSAENQGKAASAATGQAPRPRAPRCGGAPRHNAAGRRAKAEEKKLPGGEKPIKTEPLNPNALKANEKLPSVEKSTKTEVPNAGAPKIQRNCRLSRRRQSPRRSTLVRSFRKSYRSRRS